ncbi:S1C family serine protease [Natronococcus jeotgali]|uniref:Peptidase S1 and S6 chymotrypsin/Hap n=1 Tax=Natronococcus jeotgali DSM 18795 TaxID=1227498 RepID=L9X7D3_9EURY|nr:trypsin-like peptidase domain-containing protein [Natronococcus jeotgali]ELY57356.1 peptidase S1 and S6 chymotrypsin/Hap [Natronococcus jeotgali DSM 18795]
MSPDVTRRRLLGVAVGSVGAAGAGGVASAQEDRYAEIYAESIDAVVLVSVGGDGGTEGLGSGFLVDDDRVVTNHHVVEGADEVELQFRDERWRTAAVVGSDAHGDLAVLEVDDAPEAAGALSFADAEPTVGQEVLALGNPLGLDASISQGLISGVERSLPSPSGFSIPAAIQTDAPVNPGNSGGPLVDLEGDVVGVVFAGAGQTIGFAISAALARRVVPALAADGSYEHPYLGVSVVPVRPALAEANGLEEPRGVLVAEVVPGSPADGVLEPADGVATVDGESVPAGGDAIVAVDGAEIPNQERLASTIALETSPGDVVEIEFVRGGERETVELALGTRPDVDVP